MSTQPLVSDVVGIIAEFVCDPPQTVLDCRADEHDDNIALRGSHDDSSSWFRIDGSPLEVGLFQRSLVAIAGVNSTWLAGVANQDSLWRGVSQWVFGLANDMMGTRNERQRTMWLEGESRLLVARNESMRRFLGTNRIGGVRSGHGLMTVRCHDRSVLFQQQSQQSPLLELLTSLGAGLLALDVSNLKKASGIGDGRTLAAVQQCACLMALDVSNCKDGCVNDAFITAVAMACPALESLDVSRTAGHVTDVGMLVVAGRCGSSLSRLNVRSTSNKITDHSMGAIAKRCTKLRALDIGNTNGRITDATIVQLATTAGPHFEALGAANVEVVSDKALVALAANCPKLRILLLSSSMSPATKTITDVGLAKIAEGCKDLTHLSVSGHRKIGDRSIGAVFTNCKSLRFLDVSRTLGHITNGAFSALPNDCELRHLDCTETGGKITDSGLARVAEACGSRLRTLNAYNVAPGISDATAEFLSMECPELRSFSFNKQHFMKRALEVLPSGVAKPWQLATALKDTPIDEAGIRAFSGIW